MIIESFLPIIIGSTLLQADAGRAFVVEAGDAQSWLTPARCDFRNPGDLQMEVLSGSWEIQSGLLVQSDSTTRSAADIQHGSSVVVLPNPKFDRCRVNALVKLDNPDRPDAEAGVAVHVEDNKYYIICSIRRGKGDSLYAALTRYGPGYDFGRMPGDLVRLPADQRNLWHQIEVLVDGAHVRAMFNHGFTLTYSFPLVEGNMPSFPDEVRRSTHVSDQTTEIHLASKWGPEVFQMSGRVGLVTRNTTARFAYFDVGELPQDTVLHTAYNPPYDRNARILPRWQYSWIMKNYTEWFLNARHLVTSEGGSPEAKGTDFDKMMDETGWPPYFFTWATVLDDMGFDSPTQWPTHNGPPTIFGYIQYYLYSGDTRPLEAAREWADWLIDSFSTPDDFPFPNLPKSTFGIREGKALTGGLADVIELDKASYTGCAYLSLYAVTEEPKYLQAALKIAKSLLPHQKHDGSFPFRVNLETGEVVAAYTASQLWHAQLYRNLAHLTGEEDYREAGDRALTWLVDGPVKTNRWWGFYGDNPEDTDSESEKSYDQQTALMTAQWLIDHLQENDEYITGVRGILDYIQEKFAIPDGIHRGVPAIGEQTGWPAFLPHHNMRLAETYARLYGVTGDPAAKELALRITNSMTWMVQADGKYRQGLNSGIENRSCLLLGFNTQLSRIMAEIPETAPEGENHLLYHSGYVKKIRYDDEAIRYESLTPSQDILVLNSKPKQVTINSQSIPEVKTPPQSRSTTTPAGWLYEMDTGRLFVLHERGTVEIK